MLGSEQTAVRNPVSRNDQYRYIAVRSSIPRSAPKAHAHLQRPKLLMTNPDLSEVGATLKLQALSCAHLHVAGNVQAWK